MPVNATDIYGTCTKLAWFSVYSTRPMFWNKKNVSVFNLILCTMFWPWPHSSQCMIVVSNYKFILTKVCRLMFQFLLHTALSFKNPHLIVSIRVSTMTWSSMGCPFFRYFKALAPSLAFGVGYWTEIKWHA